MKNDPWWYLVTEVPTDYEGDYRNLPLKFITEKELRGGWIVRIKKGKEKKQKRESNRNEKIY